MSGVYLHIPFCKSRCKYCDFFSTTQLGRRDEYVAALLRELTLRAPAFRDEMRRSGESLQTIYLGGGTPSLLREADVALLIKSVRDEFLSNNTPLPSGWEVTMEANPGDLHDIDTFLGLRRAGVNRLSIGIQSLSDELLRRIGRRHTAEEALQAVRMAQEAGFDNLSVDLIYGLPGQTVADWQSDLDQVCRMGIQHVSAYCLMYEDGTPLTRALERGEISETDDETLVEMQRRCVETLENHGIMRYEVNNYALPGRESRHNSSYWTGQPYLGLGAGAHSYDGQSCRSYNPDDLDAYIASLQISAESGTASHNPLPLTTYNLPLIAEPLSPDDRYNELVMLSLRTVKGLDLQRVPAAYLQHCLSAAEPHLAQGLLVYTDAAHRQIAPTPAGFDLLNRIIEDMMI